jgi:hypothetical protein
MSPKYIGARPRAGQAVRGLRLDFGYNSLSMPDYPLTSKIKRIDIDVLAIHCGDYRFQSAFQEFLNRTLSLDGNYDLMVIPGGPLSLTLVEYLPKFNWASWRWLRFFAEQHKIRRLDSAPGLRLLQNDARSSARLSRTSRAPGAGSSPREGRDEKGFATACRGTVLRRVGRDRSRHDRFHFRLTSVLGAHLFRRHRMLRLAEFFLRTRAIWRELPHSFRRGLRRRFSVSDPRCSCFFSRATTSIPR